MAFNYSVCVVFRLLQYSPTLLPYLDYYYATVIGLWQTKTE